MNGDRRATAAAWTWAAVGVGWLLLGWAFAPNFIEMASQWAASEKYQHAYLVIPGALFLAWQRRETLRAAWLQPAPLALLPVLAVGIGWLLGRLAGVQLIEQLAAVALPGLLLWAIAGHAAARALAWPLTFLLFLVPAGDFLIPALMNWTADFTVTAVQASGVPIYRDGMRLSIPAGDFLVLEACSGVRYLLASAALGVFCAGAFFRSSGRRLACIAAFLLVPLIANGMRAYAVVMLGHYSAMRWVEYHLVIGQVLFAAVCFLSCLVVARLAEDTRRRRAPAPEHHQSPGRLAMVTVLAIVAATAGPLLAAPVSAWQDSRPLGAAPALPRQVPGWQLLTELPNDWQPAYHNYSTSDRAGYARRRARVQVFLFAYGHQSQQAELINATNRDFRPQDWDIIDQRSGSSADGIAYRETEIRDAAGNKRLIWRWYLLGDRALQSPAAAKFRQLATILDPVTSRSAAIVVGMRFAGTPDAARAELAEFVRDFCAAARDQGGVSACGG